MLTFTWKPDSKTRAEGFARFAATGGRYRHRGPGRRAPAHRRWPDAFVAAPPVKAPRVGTPTATMGSCDRGAAWVRTPGVQTPRRNDTAVLRQRDEV